MEPSDRKIFIVTGCTGGIGKAVCRKVYDTGGIVIGLNKDIFKRGEFLHDQFSCDLGSGQSESILKFILDKYGSPDYLIHTAGSLIPGRFSALSEMEINYVKNSNLSTLLNLLKTFLPVMEKRGEGHIIVIGSLGGAIPMPYSALYSATKFAVRGFCLSIAEELQEKGIHLSLLSPGPVRTSMLNIESLDDNSVMSFIQEPMEPEDVASGVIKVIKKPVQELFIPFSGKLGVLLYSFFPGIFKACFPLLKRAGKRTMINYRKNNSVNNWAET